MLYTDDRSAFNGERIYHIICANDFYGATDSDILEAAIRSREADGIVVIPPRKSEVDPSRDYWLLDRAMLLPENTTVILQNCKLKLSDRCRDNFSVPPIAGWELNFPNASITSTSAGKACAF